MCKLGDIIVVNKYTSEEGKEIGRRSFVVIDDNPNSIRGIDYTFVTTVISSFKSKKHRDKKLKYKGNIEVFYFEKYGLKTEFKNSSYIKADKLFYFNKDKIDYYFFGRVTDDLLDELIKLIIQLEKENKVTHVINNI